MSEIVTRITNYQRLLQSKQKAQATNIQEEEIGISVNLPYVEGTSRKPRHILRSHKVRSTFYIKSTLRKLLYKPKDQVGTEDKKISLMKYTLLTVKQSTLVNLDGL